MKILNKMLKMFFIVLMTINLAYALQEDEITKVMKNKIQSATKVLKDKQMPTQTKQEEIFKLFDPIFDYTLMSKLALGNQWKKLDSNQQKVFIDSFSHKLKYSYADKLDLYTNQKVEIGKQKKIKPTRITLAMIIYGEDENFEIIYKFYKNKSNQWFIYDVDILGVSIIQTYRSQFQGILQKESFETLIEKLNKTDA